MEHSSNGMLRRCISMIVTSNLQSLHLTEAAPSTFTNAIFSPTLLNYIGDYEIVKGVFLESLSTLFLTPNSRIHPSSLRTLAISSEKWIRVELLDHVSKWFNSSILLKWWCNRTHTKPLPRRDQVPLRRPPFQVLWLRSLIPLFSCSYTMQWDFLMNWAPLSQRWVRCWRMVTLQCAVMLSPGSSR